MRYRLLVNILRLSTKHSYARQVLECTSPSGKTRLIKKLIQNISHQNRILSRQLEDRSSQSFACVQSAFLPLPISQWVADADLKTVAAAAQRTVLAPVEAVTALPAAFLGPYLDSPVYLRVSP
ncbi:hypothetical protein MGYG_00997 [Nannizzia gypsea CBS 118893]|uniref:Uncharacterized protein n=1 Tax=Arthroderma gypseum (strain ATCC MYA-4604 / CBS 118893) TaxID=535722 RepID=E5R3E6_ARTGP|nr:hypothetical protein MGYG_00997 [Nannizzia gypsea CBS 118893]EFQ97961.1 hypothetical protein MGYG_00997 [Nannizzia gypsea CBS 118893]